MAVHVKTKWWESRTVVGGLLLVAAIVAVALGGRALGLGDELIQWVIGAITAAGASTLGLNKWGKNRAREIDAQLSLMSDDPLDDEPDPRDVDLVGFNGGKQ